MSIADEIERLQALHAQGALTADEFARAKVALLARQPNAPSAQEADHLRAEREYLKLQSDLHTLDREWEREREGYILRGRYGARYLPSEGMSILGIVGSVMFGLFWIFEAPSMGAPDFFPLFGVLLMVLGVGISLYSLSKAKGYKQAEQNYVQRRQALTARQRRPE